MCQSVVNKFFIKWKWKSFTLRVRCLVIRSFWKMYQNEKLVRRHVLIEKLQYHTVCTYIYSLPYSLLSFILFTLAQPSIHATRGFSSLLFSTFVYSSLYRLPGIEIEFVSSRRRRNVNVWRKFSHSNQIRVSSGCMCYQILKVNTQNSLPSMIWFHFIYHCGWSPQQQIN